MTLHIHIAGFIMVETIQTFSQEWLSSFYEDIIASEVVLKLSNTLRLHN